MTSPIFYPKSEIELVDLVRQSTAAKNLVSIISGSGIAVEATPIAERRIISLAEMPPEITLMAEDLTVIVPAQMNALAFAGYLEEHTFFLPIDLPDGKSATIGGMAATNTRSLRTARYGGLRNYILGMDIVTASGEAMRVGGLTIKNVVGYDLAQFLVGSWGEMAILVRLIFKLLPLPEKRVTLLVDFAEDNAALAALKAIADTLLQPSRLEWVSRRTSAELGLWSGGSVLLLELDGFAATMAEKIDRFRPLLTENGGRLDVIESPIAQAACWQTRLDLWSHIRTQMSAGVFVTLKIPPGDCVALGQLQRQLDGIAGAWLFGHGFDGVWHIVLPADSAEVIAAHIASFQQIGLITLEKSFGLPDYQPFSRRTMPPAEVELRQRIKQAFDPANILRRAAASFTR